MFYEQYRDSYYKKVTLKVWDMVVLGWHLVEVNFLPLAIITILMSIPTNLIAYVLINGEFLPIDEGVSGLKDIQNIYKLSGFVFSVIGMLASYYVIRNYLAWITVSIGNALLYGVKKWSIFIMASILYMLSVMLGLIFLIIPGIVFAVLFSFFSYAVVFEEKSPIQALKYSKFLYSKNGFRIFFKSFGFGIISGFLFGIIPLVIAFMIGYFTPESIHDNIIYAVVSDTFIDVISIPSYYIWVWLFLGVQKYIHEPEIEVPAVEPTLEE
jgi:hypothetical protein